MNDVMERETIGAGRLAEADVLRYLLAGNALVTIRNAATGNRFTYQVQAPRQPRLGEAVPYFVKVLSGPDNGADYRYMGTIFEGRSFRLTNKSRVGPEAPSYKAFDYVFHRLANGIPLARTVEVWHEGKCGRCGRLLTVPESVERGIGPDCAGHMEAGR